jgi:hypothetical protein
MKTSNNHNHPAEALKKSIHNVSEKSKENIKNLIDVNSKQLESAIDTNKKAFDSVSKMLYDKEMDPSMVNMFKANFTKGVKLSEDAIDSIVDVQKRSIDLSIDFATKFLDIIRDGDMGTKRGAEKLTNLVKENFDQSTELAMENIENMVSIYNENLNMALNYNKKLADTMNSQIASLFKIQKKNFDTFFGEDTFSQWWKTTAEEKV